MSVRSARPSDRPQILAWKRALWDVDDHDDGDETAFVWEAPDGSIGGFISVSVRPGAEGCKSAPVPYVEGWYVTHALRRRGIGRALMHAAEAWAVDAGFDEIGSDGRVDDAVSLDAHRAFGFVPTEQLQFFRKPLGPR